MGHLLPPEPFESLDAYLAAGGGRGLRQFDALGPDGVVDVLRRSGLRGRGGGGFPTGTKWASLRGGGPEVGDRYVVANGAEGEPATFKDRALMAANPYQVIEGVEIAVRTIGAVGAYIAVKASFGPQILALERALSEMAEAGLVGSAPITLVSGPDEYLFGEEKALLEVIEGDEPLPRFFPPYIHGLFTAQPQMGWSAGIDLSSDGVEVPSSNPTLVNNVETLANVPVILERGADWHRSLGTELSPGNVIATVVGDTVRAGVGEVELGTPLGDVIASVGGGPRPGHQIKAVLSGIANPVLTGPDQLGTPVSYEGMEAAGSGLGAVGFAVYDEGADMVAVACAMSRFLYVESCGQCPPCKWGTGEVTRLLNRILVGDGTEHDIEVIGARLLRVTDANRCFLGEQESRVIGSLLQAFPEEFVAHLEGTAPPPAPVLVPKLIDLREGVAVYDERQARKRADWTFADE